MSVCHAFSAQVQFGRSKQKRLEREKMAGQGKKGTQKNKQNKQKEGQKCKLKRNGF